MTTFTKSRQHSDFFVSDWDKKYQTDGFALRNNTPAELTADRFELIAQPVKRVSADLYEFVLAGDEANATGLLYTTEAISKLAVNASTKRVFMAIVRGPSVINRQGWPANDVAGNALDTAALETAIAGFNPPIITVVEHKRTTEGTL